MLSEGSLYGRNEAYYTVALCFFHELFSALQWWHAKQTVCLPHTMMMRLTRCCKMMCLCDQVF